MIRARILLLACFLISSAGLAKTEAIDLTDVFRAGGIDIDRLMVFKISGVVLIRGRTSNVAMAVQAGVFAKSLGYQRVANLIEIIPELQKDLAISLLSRIDGVAAVHPELVSVKRGRAK